MSTYVNRLRTGLVLRQPTATRTNGFRYDAAKRLTNITSQAGSFTNEYFPGVAGASGYSSSLIKRLLLPNLSIITNDYDSVARQISTWLKTSTGTLLDSATYGYNAANQRTNFANAAGTNYLYGYDNIGQLTNADSSVNSEDRSYVYDAAWNLSSRKIAGVSSSFTVDSKNQYIRAPYPLVTHCDTNGNLIDSQSFKRTYAYDDENRLIEFASYAVASSSPSVGDKLTEFVYDGLRKGVKPEVGF